MCLNENTGKQLVDTPSTYFYSAAICIRRNTKLHVPCLGKQTVQRSPITQQSALKLRGGLQISATRRVKANILEHVMYLGTLRRSHASFYTNLEQPQRHEIDEIWVQGSGSYFKVEFSAEGANGTRERGSWVCI